MAMCAAKNAAVKNGGAALDSQKTAKNGNGNERKVPQDARSSEPSSNIKWFVLIFLVVQNSSASIAMRYSRAQPGGNEWNTQTGVIMQEVVKAVTCIVLLIRERAFCSVFADKIEAFKTGIPAILYLAQNNLQYIALGYLDASTYAVLYQLKILTTALLSVTMLGKELSFLQWVALAALTAGASIVVVSQMAPSSEPSQTRTMVVPGLCAVLTACLMSGLAGVYFEKLLKGSKVSLWTRNLQLALYSIVIGIAGLYGQRNSTFKSSEFFKGYNSYVWISILNNAFGGLLIAVAIKYADNILKNFSASLSIVLTAVVSVFVFDSVLNLWFGLGMALVIQAVFLYSKVNPFGLLANFEVSKP